MTIKELREVTTKSSLVLVKAGNENIYKGIFKEMPRKLNKEEISSIYPSFNYDHDPCIVIIIK